MLRVWGGGWYERDAFYQACDRYGIMLWHDFMFACSPYPDHLEWFRSEVEKEADYQTRRLSRHACLALWSGCNENNWGFRDWWHEQTKAGARIYNYLLPGIVQRNSPEIPYWNGSPYGGETPNSENVGDHHRWHECMMHPQMEKRVAPEEYDKCRSLFVSEFGYVGGCCKKTTLAYMGDEDIDTTSEAWQQHTNTFEKKTVAAGIRKHYADPEQLSIDDYLLCSGLCQGLMYQYSLESMRYRPNCHGGIFWMFEDCWGEIGWTIIDYYLRRKPSWYFARRAFAPIRLIMRAAGNKIRVIAANDTPKNNKLELECGYIALDGTRSELKRFKAEAAALERTECCVFAKGQHDPANGLWIARCLNNTNVEPAVFRAVDFRRLRTTDPELFCVVTREERTECTVKVSAKTYAHAVHFTLPDYALPEDDFFDLLPGQTKKIRITSARPINAEAIKITCVNQLRKE
jgi:beta-mannosidase